MVRLEWKANWDHKWINCIAIRSFSEKLDGLKELTSIRNLYLGTKASSSMYLNPKQWNETRVRNETKETRETTEVTKTRKLPENPDEVINKRSDTETTEASKVNAT